MASTSIDPAAFIAEGAIVRGDVVIGAGSSVWYNAVLRGDVEPIVIGRDTNIQDLCCIHVAKGHPVRIGDGVSVGHGAILHGCTVEDDALIGMGAIVLNGARVGRGCIVGAGALVTEGTVMPDGTVWFGNPARQVRQVRPEELEANRANVQEYKAFAQFLAKPDTKGLLLASSCPVLPRISPASLLQPKRPAVRA